MNRSVMWGVPLAAAVAVAASPAAGAGAVTPTAVVALATAPALDQTPSPSWWGTNDRVNDIKVVGGRVYLAGGFDYIGRTTGYGVTVSPLTGTLSAGSFPKVDGVVRAAVSDGAGGWFIGGDFDRVGTRVRHGVAHVLAGGAVDGGWAPDVLGGGVYAIARTSTGVVLGGTFTTVNATPANQLAKVDPTTGASMTGWRGSANGPVNALAVHRDQVYVGGAFTTLSGVNRSRLGRLDDLTGTLDSGFAGATAGTVWALAVDAAGGRLYAGGDFTSASAGGVTAGRQRLAAFALADGSLGSFSTGANGSVRALAVSADRQLAVGGLFTSLGAVGRSYLGVVSPEGAVAGFDASLTGCNRPHETKYSHGMVPCTPEVSALAVSGTTLYVGGRFGRSGTLQRHDAAAFSLASGDPTDWNPTAGNRPLVIATGGSGADVFLGGEFTSVNGLVRKGLAALDAATGAGVPEFQADTDEFVEVLVPSTEGTRLYLGGKFQTVQGQPRSRVAAISTATGQLDPAFKPKLNNAVLSLAYAQGSVYAGGKFTRAQGLDRLRAVKLDGVTGAVDPNWVANTSGPSGALRSNGMVMGIEATPDGGTVFLGGPFTSVNGTAVTGGIAVVDGVTGRLGPKQLGGVQGCSATLGPWINRLYLSDDGQRLYGGDVCPDYIYQWDAVNLSTSANPTGLRWKNLCNGGMQGRLEVNGHFYFGTHGGDKGSGGRCQAYPGGPNVSQQRFFVFDLAGTLLPFVREFDSPMGVWSFATTSQGLLVGGDFTFAGARSNVQQGLAFFAGAP